MKKLTYLLLALACMTASVSCIKDDLDPCPPDGGSVEVTLRAEKFQTQPPYGTSDTEADFTARIRSLDYLLYAGDRLIERGSADGLLSGSGASYLWRHAALPFGSYRLALVANTEAGTFAGSPNAPESFYIVYRGEQQSDHFRSVLPFEVTCPCKNEFQTVLQRVHGVTQFRFENLPSDVVTIEVSLDNVGARIPLSGEPDQTCMVTKRFAASDLKAGTDGSFLLGTFPTLPGKRTAWRLRLYGADAEAPLYQRVVTDTLRVESNQLLKLSTRFSEEEFRGKIEFTVDLDTNWDGSNEGGGQVIVS